MATVSTQGPVKSHPLLTTAVLSVVGYVLVLGTFAGVVNIFPPIGTDTVLLFSDLIAVINTCALTTLLVGFYFIRTGQIKKHRAAMLTAFGLIMVFLVLYLWKVGGGFEKEIVIRQGQFLAVYAGIIEPAYLVMLAIHILLSAVAVPVLIYPVVVGLTHTPNEIRETAHARVGRIAVAAWSLSLFLGVVTYFLLNHVYSWVPR